jgi:hypothetical protein
VTLAFYARDNTHYTKEKIAMVVMERNVNRTQVSTGTETRTERQCSLERE